MTDNSEGSREKGYKRSSGNRVRSVTGPTGKFPGWKPSPEVAGLWKNLTKPKQQTEESIQEGFVNHATKVLETNRLLPGRHSTWMTLLLIKAVRSPFEISL